MSGLMPWSGFSRVSRSIQLAKATPEENEIFSGVGNGVVGTAAVHGYRLSLYGFCGSGVNLAGTALTFLSTLCRKL